MGGVVFSLIVHCLNCPDILKNEAQQILSEHFVLEASGQLAIR